MSDLLQRINDLPPENRKLLEELLGKEGIDMSRVTAEENVVPRAPLEQRIATIWQEVLHIEHVGLQQNFFDLGGHSIRMAEVQTKLNESLGLELSIVELFKYPTVKELAHYLEQKQQTETQPPVTPPTAQAEQQRKAIRRQQQLNQRLLKRD